MVPWVVGGKDGGILQESASKINHGIIGERAYGPPARREDYWYLKMIGNSATTTHAHTPNAGR
jgi:hypothetical protein